MSAASTSDTKVTMTKSDERCRRAHRGLGRGRSGRVRDDTLDRALAGEAFDRRGHRPAAWRIGAVDERRRVVAS